MTTESPVDERRNNFAAFELHWDFELSPRMLNAEMLVKHRDGKMNSNPLLNILVQAYVDMAITTSLLKIYETADFFQLKNISEVEPLIEYRNKFIAHRETNRFSGDTKELIRKTTEMGWNIFNQVKNGAEALSREIRQKNIITKLGAIPVHPIIDAEEVSELIKMLTKT